MTARRIAIGRIFGIPINLLPGFPLDGGRVLRALLWGWSGNLVQATRISSLLGRAMGLGLLGLGVWAVLRGQWVGGIWYACLGFFLRDAARASYYDVVLREWARQHV